MGNILSGYELIARTIDKPVYGKELNIIT